MQEQEQEQERERERGGEQEQEQKNTKKSKSKSNRNSGVRRFRLRNYSCFSPGWRMLPDLLRIRNRRFRQVRLSRPAPCAIIFMRSSQCDKLDTLVIRSHCPRKLAVRHCLAQSAAISMVLPTLTSEGALTIVDIVRRRFVWLALPPYPGAFYVHLWAPRT